MMRKVDAYYTVMCRCGLNAEYVADHLAYPNAAMAHLTDHPDHQISVSLCVTPIQEYVEVYADGSIEAGDGS